MILLLTIGAFFIFVLEVKCENLQQRESAFSAQAHDDDDDDAAADVDDRISLRVSDQTLPADSHEDMKQTDRLYRVIKAEKGGWERSDVAATEKGSYVYCHKDITQCDEGVDWLSQHRTMLCKVQERDTTLIRVKCDNQDEIQLLPDECCEAASAADTCVYATPKGLIHYATWGNYEPVTIAGGMKIVEDTYEAQLRTGSPPVLLNYFADYVYDTDKEEFQIDSNIPFRVEQSSLYKPPHYRALLREQVYEISDKWQLLKRIKALEMNFLGGPFPVTYLTILEALTEVDDPTAHFFIRSLKDDYGTGVLVESREQLNGLWERHATIQGVQVVIQPVIQDLSLMHDHSFDIAFYVLVHAGRVYMQQNAQVLLTPRQVFNGSDNKQQESSIDNDCVHSFLSNKSTGKEKQWLEAIRAQLVATLPVLEPVIHATAEDNDGTTYQVFAGKAMIRDTGEALIRSIVDWPVVDWDETGYNNTSCASIGKKTIDERKTEYEETLSIMHGDFFAIVLGLANTTAVTDDSETFLLDGRVREVVGFQRPSKIIAPL